MAKNIKDRLQKIDKAHFSLLINIGKVAEEQNLKAYLVGGMVRDLLLGFDNLDIDIVVENNAALLAESIVKRFPNCHLSAKHDRFHTAKVIFNIDGKDIPVDLASTRQETYEHPAALPTVTVSDLQKDLIRRDFTINALAVSLLPNDFGDIVDLFNGLEDLKNKKISILHEKSFIDDPTRMIRAVRFAAKLGFEIELNSQKLLKEAINSKQFDNLIEKIRGDRVKIEVRYLFNLPNIEKAIKVFFESGIYKMMSTELQPYTDTISTVPIARINNQWLICLGIILKAQTTQDQEKIINNLQLTGDEAKIIKSGLVAFENLNKLKVVDPTIIHRELKNLAIESVSIIKVLSNKGANLSDLIDDFINKTSKIKLEITGQDLINMGVSQGKQIGEILDKVLELKIKNPNMKKDDEIKEANKLKAKL